MLPEKKKREKKKNSNMDPTQLLRKLVENFLIHGEPLTAFIPICA